MERELFTALGYRWNRSAVPEISAHTIERAVWRYQRALPTFVWDAAVLEGNPFTFPDVQTLMDGVTVGGHKVSDAEQVLNLAEAAKELTRLVKSGEFRLDKPTSDRLQELTARGEALETGHFRGEGPTILTPGVNLGEHGRYMPPETEPGGRNLVEIFERGVAAIHQYVAQPFEQAIAYFLFAALQQFYFDGNKRTGRWMMNGHLMAHGIDAISVPAQRRREFNASMVGFFRTKDAAETFGFLASCHPDLDPETRY